MPTIHLLIKGKVQGVYYRASAKEVADRLHLSGWVKNTREGHVEVLASGHEEDLRRFVEWCKQGPERAVVSEITELREGYEREGTRDDVPTKFENEAAQAASVTGFSIIRG